MENGLAQASKKKTEYIAKMVGHMFASRTYSHRAHLRTASYAKHMALNEFYNEIVELADELAEVAQGMFGKLDIPVVVEKGDVSDPIGSLTMYMNECMKLGETCDVGALKNIIDSIQALYLKTLYKLKELN